MTALCNFRFSQQNMREMLTYIPYILTEGRYTHIVRTYVYIVRTCSCVEDMHTVK